MSPKPASTAIPRNAVGCRRAKDCAPCTRSLKFPFLIESETTSDSIRNGNFNDLVQGAQSFARRQPTAFLGMAVLAGFGLIRFLKSSAEGSNDGQSGWSVTNDLNTTSRADAGGQGYGNQFTR